MTALGVVVLILSVLVTAMGLLLAGSYVSLQTRQRAYLELQEHHEDVLAAMGEIAESEISVASDAEYDPLSIANPLFTLREYFFLPGYGPSFVERHLPYQDLMVHIRTAMRNGQRFEIAPVPTPADDAHTPGTY